MIPNRKSPNIFADVRKFIDLAQADLRSELNHPPKAGAMALAKKLINEEVFQELWPDLDKLINGDFSLELIAKVLDHALDSIYVFAWLVEILSLPGEAGWNEIQAANMSKFPLVDYGTGGDNEYQFKEIFPLDMSVDKVDITEKDGHWIIRNKETQKIVKPAWFVPPDIHEVVLQILTMRKLRTMPDVITDPFMREYFNEMEARRERKEIDV